MATRIGSGPKAGIEDGWKDVRRGKRLTDGVFRSYALQTVDDPDVIVKGLF